MKIIDLTKNYSSYITEKNDIEGYVATYPAFFSHYFKYWAHKDDILKGLTPGEVKLRVNIIKNNLKVIEKQISTCLNLSLDELEIILFVGANSTNGHAFLDTDNKFKAWIPVESYISDSRAKIFLTHEIVHALHYNISPEYYFKNKNEMINVGSCLATEGLATYLAKIIPKTTYAQSMFSDYITPQTATKLLKGYKRKDKGLREYILKNYNKSDSSITIFNASDSTDIYKYKAGYYIGMKIYKNIFSRQKPSKLLYISKDEFNKIAIKFLKQ